MQHAKKIIKEPLYIHAFRAEKRMNLRNGKPIHPIWKQSDCYLLVKEQDNVYNLIKLTNSIYHPEINSEGAD